MDWIVYKGPINNDLDNGHASGEGVPKRHRWHGGFAPFGADDADWLGGRGESGYAGV